MRTSAWTTCIFTALLVCACDPEERSFCSTDEDCLYCEVCIDGLCVLDQFALNACGDCAPEPREICGDSKDNDCDGLTDEECGGPCEGIVCDQPPGPCHQEQGVCSNGVCTYQRLTDGTACDDGQACTVDDSCRSGMCSGAPMTCDNPPPDECITSNTLRAYNPGYCVQGSCVYPYVDVYCENGCLNGVAGARCQECTPDCSGRVCGPDPVCGESCGTCSGGEVCDGSGQCVIAGCAPDAYEPDDDPTSATVMALNSPQTHSLCPAGDQDWWELELEAFARVTLETSGTSGDTRMWLYDASLVEIGFDDDSGGDYFSLIDIDLDPGRYYVQIDEYYGEELESYTLSAEACVPDCSGVQCGPDPVCGAECGACPPGQVCSPEGTCTNGHEEVWSYQTGGDVLSSPAVGADGTVYVGSYDYNLYALSPDGTLRWSYSTGGAIYSSPAVGSDGTVYVGCDDYKLYALNPDGTLKWSYATGGYVDSSPAIGADGTVFIGSQDNQLYALNPDGTMKWSYATGGDVDSSPSISEDGVLYAGSDDGKVYALTQEGDFLWSYTTGDAVHASPAIGADKTVYAGSHDGNLYALNPDGTLKWSFATTDIIRSSAAVAADGTVYFGSVDGRLYAVKADGSLKWSFQTADDVRSSPAIGSDGTVYFGSYEGRLYVLNPDGSLRWVSSGITDSVFSSPAVAADGTLYIGSHDNRVYAFSTDDQLSDSPWPKFRGNLQNTGRQ